MLCSVIFKESDMQKLILILVVSLFATAMSACSHHYGRDAAATSSAPASAPAAPQPPSGAMH
jgi:hypothetical protein